MARQPLTHNISSQQSLKKVTNPCNSDKVISEINPLKGIHDLNYIYMYSEIYKSQFR